MLKTNIHVYIIYINRNIYKRVNRQVTNTFGGLPLGLFLVSAEEVAPLPPSLARLFLLPLGLPRLRFGGEEVSAKIARKT